MTTYHVVPNQKIFGEAKQFFPEFFDDCRNNDFVSFYGDAQILLRFYVKTFFLVFTCFGFLKNFLVKLNLSFYCALI